VFAGQHVPADQRQVRVAAQPLTQEVGQPAVDLDGHHPVRAGQQLLG